MAVNVAKCLLTFIKVMGQTLTLWTRVIVLTRPYEIELTNCGVDIIRPDVTKMVLCLLSSPRKDYYDLLKWN